MDPVRFDRLTKTFSSTETRRSALRGLLAATLGLLGLTDAAAESRKHRQPQRRDHARATAKNRRKATSEGPCGNGSGKANACRKHKDCCTGYCHKKKGRCRCKKLGQGCKADRTCCASFGQPMTC